LSKAKNTNQITTRLNHQTSKHLFDEISSESSEGGRRFLKNPEQRLYENSTSSNETKSKEVVNHLVNDSFVNELLALRENDATDVNTISVLSFSAPIDSPGALNQKDLREIVPHKKISNKSAKTPETNDVEVQTIWSGDLPQCRNIPHSYLIQKYEKFPASTNNTTLKIKSMMSSLTSYKTLNTLTTYNPCLTALDNMLKQQLNLTREFLTTQRNLHETISKAISQCVTDDYNNN
ncbi:hypothetical protein KSF78_0003593, partial [Schistosoma japonicum]